jgi:hypothetical protein
MGEQRPVPDAPAQPEERPLPPEVDAAIRAVAGSERPEQAALTLAAIAHRAIAELNRMSRAEASRRRGQSDWGAWASLANAARDAVLKLTACRRGATEVAKRSTAAQ